MTHATGIVDRHLWECWGCGSGGHGPLHAPPVAALVGAHKPPPQDRCGSQGCPRLGRATRPHLHELPKQPQGGSMPRFPELELQRESDMHHFGKDHKARVGYCHRHCAAMQAWSSHSSFWVGPIHIASQVMETPDDCMPELQGRHKMPTQHLYSVTWRTFLRTKRALSLPGGCA